MIHWFFKHIEKIDKVEILRRITLFSELQESDLRLLANETRLIEYKKGDFIYREGAPADCFYAIVSGRIKVLTHQEQHEKVLTYLYEGDYFGELSLLTEEPHSVSVVVQNDALLLRLEKGSFHKIIARCPQVTVQISRVLGSRLKQKDREGEKIKTSKLISIYSASPQVGKTHIAMNLAASLMSETHRKTILIDFAENEHGVLNFLKVKETKKFDLKNADVSLEEIEKFVTILPSEFHVLEMAPQSFKEKDVKRLTSFFSRLVFSYDFILLDLPVKRDAITQSILTQSDLIYLVTDADRQHLLETKEMLELSLLKKEMQQKIRLILNEIKAWYPFSPPHKEIVLGKKVAHHLPYTPALEEDLQKPGIPFVAENPSSHYSKMIRYMAREIGDVLVGLALSSGAALGLAHVGVLKVLMREKIPIDIVSGASIGAVVAATWASGKTPEEMEEIVEKISTPGRTFALLADFDLFWKRGFFRGVKVSRFMRGILGNRTFQDTWLPLKLVAVDLGTREEIVLEEGPLHKAVRASMSIPGILQPLIDKEQVIVDGAVLSPVPIDCLRQAGVKKIIAVNVLPSPEAVLERKKHLEETEQKKNATLRKKNFVIRVFYRLRKKIYHFFLPNIFDIMMQSMQTMEFQNSEIACRNADVVIRPTHISASWFEFFEAKKFIRRGEEEAEKQIEEIKQLVFEPEEKGP